MGWKLTGGVSGIDTEVDPTFQAARVSLRPVQLSSYQSIGALTGNVTAAAANGALFSLRNLASNLLLIRRVGWSFLLTTAFTAAQKLDYGLMFARAFTASDTGGTAIALTGSNTKQRTSLATLTSVDCRIATTAALTAGTKTLDTNYLGIIGGWGTGIGAQIGSSPDNLLSQSSGDYPLILAINEGINIVNITLMGATGVGVGYVNLEVAEVTSY